MAATGSAIAQPVERGKRIPPMSPQSGEHGQRAQMSEAKWNASVASAGEPVRSATRAQLSRPPVIDGDRSEQHQHRPHGMAQFEGVAGGCADCFPDDPCAGDGHQAGFEEGREVFDLSVAVGVILVGGLIGDANGEERECPAPARSSPEWAASDNTPSEPEMSPAASFSSVMQVAASIDCSATRRFSEPSSRRGWIRRRFRYGGMSLRLLEYRRAHRRVQPGDSEGVGLPCAVGISGCCASWSSISGGWGKCADRRRQIAVRAVSLPQMTRPMAGNTRRKVKGVGLADQAAGLAEFEDSRTGRRASGRDEIRAGRLRSWPDCESRTR